MAWSYSLYMMALEREELLIRHAHLEQGGASVSTVSGNIAPDSQPIGTSEGGAEEALGHWVLMCCGGG